MQGRLPGTEPQRVISPADPGAEPELWVRQLRIVSELSANAEHIIRDVELRRGLNIVWTPSNASPDGNSLFKAGLSGHTAGKTTFCRFLRYILGEGKFAPEQMRERLRAEFPKSWILGEVRVKGVAWAIARPITIGPAPFVVRDATVDEILEGTRLEYKAFLDELENLATSHLPAKHFPGSDRAIHWSHILPWLTRDQECRFADFLVWRHSSSDSGSPKLVADDRQFVVRSVLGLVSDEERQELTENARLVSEKKKAAKQAPLLAHQASVDHERVKSLLDHEVAPPSSELFGKEAREELERRYEMLEAQRQQLRENDRRKVVEQELENAVAAEAVAREGFEKAKATHQHAKDTLEIYQKESRGKDQEAVLANLPPPTDYCNVPLWKARQHECPLAVGRPIDLAAKRTPQTTEDELQALRDIVQAHEQDVKKKKAALSDAESETKRARREVFRVRTTYDEQAAQLVELEQRLERIKWLIERAEDSRRRSEELSQKLNDLAKDIDKSYDRQELLRNERRQALREISTAFDYVVRAMLGDDVDGHVKASGRSLVLEVNHNGQRDSAALSTVKLLAFDIAALIAGIEGNAFTPGILIHDGPREADLGEEIYERLFLFGETLEGCFSDKAGFQYIVTTTTKPPVELCMEPWMRLELRGAPSTERLLKTDL